MEKKQNDSLDVVFSKKEIDHLPEISLIIRPLVNGDLVGQTLLLNFLEVLGPISSKIVISSKNMPEKINENILAKLVILPVGGTEDINDSLFVRIWKYLLCELEVTVNLIKYGSKCKVVILFLGASSYVAPAIVAKLLGKKLFYIVMGSSSEVVSIIYAKKQFNIFGSVFHFIFFICEKINYSLSDNIIVYSETLIKKFGIQNYHKKIISTGSRFVNTNLFTYSDDVNVRQWNIGYFGRLTEEKGIVNFLEAIPLILKEMPQIHFTIVGDGWIKKDIETFLLKHNIERSVTLLGSIPHDHVGIEMKKMKLIVVPSYTEGLPNVILEAMATGTPVLATSVGAIPDLVQDDVTGFILSDNSPECITSGVLKIIHFNELETITQNARIHIEKNYTYPSAVERYKKILLK